MPDVILNGKELSNSAYSHIINAPLANIDIADWLFNLPEAEYQLICLPHHPVDCLGSEVVGRRSPEYQCHV